MNYTVINILGHTDQPYYQGASLTRASSGRTPCSWHYNPSVLATSTKRPGCFLNYESPPSAMPKLKSTEQLAGCNTEKSWAGSRHHVFGLRPTEKRERRWWCQRWWGRRKSALRSRLCPRADKEAGQPGWDFALCKYVLKWPNSIHLDQTGMFIRNRLCDYWSVYWFSTIWNIKL